MNTFEFRHFAEVPSVARADMLSRWNPAIEARQVSENTIEIFDVIGAGFFDDGVMPAQITEALRNMEGDIFVDINSPGGSVFDGIAIANAIQMYDGHVTVRILGLAASAAAVIAMAGDTIQIAESAELMIHKTWTIAIGNSDDFERVIAEQRRIDQTQAAIFAEQSGLTEDEVMKMLSEETFFTGKEAVDAGLVDAIIPGTEISRRDNEDRAERKALEMHACALQQTYPNMSRKERRQLMRRTSGKPSAATPVKPSADGNTMPGAGDEIAEALNALAETIRSGA